MNTKILLFLSVFITTTVMSSSDVFIPEDPKSRDTTKMNLTDQDRFTSQNFIHDGLSQRTKDEGCAKVDQGCESGISMKVMGIDENMMKMIPFLYTMVVGNMAGDFSVNKTKSTTTDSGTKDVPVLKKDITDKTDGFNEMSDKDKYEQEENSDYCQYIPMAGEILAQTTNQAGASPIKAQQNASTNKQTDSLYNTAREEDNRAKSAEIQATTWGIGAACYVAMAATGTANWSDPKLYLKLGGTAVLALYFNEIKSKHKDRANQLRTLAAKMPGAGDCNPITDVSCYCAQPETIYDPKYCLPQDGSIKVADGFISSCIDNKLQSDPTCNCKNTNSCYDQIFLNDIGKQPFGNGFANSTAGIKFADLTKGKVGAAVMGGSGFAANALKKIDFSKLGDPKNPLTAKQNKMGAALSKLGIPPRLAANIASNPIKSSSKNAFRFRGYSSRRARKYTGRKRKSKVYTYGKTSSRRRSSRKSGSSFDMKKYLKKGKHSKRSKVYKFARRAESRAQINQDTSKPIFEIISRRYKITAWKTLNWE